jgi:perosamine synthetase
MDSGTLSAYYGSWGKSFYGGPQVNHFEEKAKEFFDCKHAITVNSWTSGLTAAVGALELEPGDEVIVTPWTMCASATAILQWNAIPVFADIETDGFCIDPASIESNISSKTRAIMSVDIFGQSADVTKINSIAKKHNLKVISDTAQAPGAMINGRFAGTCSDIGGFSLNYHKHFHTGEGGIVVTNDDDYAEKIRLIRNHAEAVVGDMGRGNITNMLGSNYRLGEIECAIGIEQLKKLPSFIASRQEAAHRLTSGLSGLEGLTTPYVREGSSHVYYIYPLRIDTTMTNVDKYRIVSALEAEGVQGLLRQYINVHMLPMFQQKICYGSGGFPWTIGRQNISYKKGICPIAERMNDVEFFGLELCMFNYTQPEIDLIVDAFHKVWERMDDLKC